MSKKMTPLEALKKVKQARYFVDFELDAKVGEDYKEELKIIETELKEKARQDKVVKFIQEVIVFGAKIPEVKMINGTQTITLNDITAAVSLEIQRKISNKKRELFRQWVLDTCFPKELKALEIIKNNIVKTIDELLIVHNELDNSITFEFKVNVKTQEDYDLLVEKLLGEKQ